MKTIALTANEEVRFWSKVQKTESCWDWQASSSNGYGRFFYKRGGRATMLAAHRVAYTLLVGEIQDGYVVDHKCRRPSCVNPGHLRAVTVKQNAEHRGGANLSNGASGIQGVYWSKQKSRWIVRARHLGRMEYGGAYVDIREAESAAIAMRNRLYTHNDLDRVVA